MLRKRRERAINRRVEEADKRNTRKPVQVYENLASSLGPKPVSTEPSDF